MSKKNGKSNILLIDDDQSVTKMLRMLLETRGYNVDVAHTGQEGLEKANQNTDLILLDLILPDADGFDICRKFKEEEVFSKVPIIILSSRLLSKDIVEGLYLGADDYLTKPFEYEELVARMEAVMRRASLFSHGHTASHGEEAIISDLRKIIDEELVVPFFQPIFLLKEMKLLGVEALCRPKIDSMLANPEILFKAAIQYGFYHELEILSWRKAIEYAATFLVDEKLFLNCNPYLVEGPKFLTIKSIFEKNHIEAKNIVLEITERSAVSDYKSFYEYLGHYRKHGFKFAVDDVGGGYASLESIVQTKPEVVKIDRHIVHQLEKDTFKKSIVKFIVAFCRENNILSIAEGIERREDLEAVIQLGVDAGQGYYLYRPTPEIDLESMHNLQLPTKNSSQEPLYE